MELIRWRFLSHLYEYYWYKQQSSQCSCSAAVSNGYTAPVVPVCTLTPNICWSWRRSRKDWNMGKFFVVKSVNPLKSGYSKRSANNVTRPVNQYWEEDHQRCCRGGSRRFRGFNHPPPLQARIQGGRAGLAPPPPGKKKKKKKREKKGKEGKGKEERKGKKEEEEEKKRGKKEIGGGGGRKGLASQAVAPPPQIKKNNREGRKGKEKG